MFSLSIVQSATARALASGALQPIETEATVIEDAGVAFVVRAVASLARKQEAVARPDPLGNYEPDLFVGDVSATHYVLLNKFNVLPQHLLLVTRHFERQEEPLTVQDFAALERCMAGFGDVAFYNSGAEAGASQLRKHLQLVPMPQIPIEPFLDAGGRLPFRHAFARTSARGIHELYQELLAACGITTQPYNLLLTRRWLLVVPRSRERFDSLTVNALGFAGSLFARSREELELIRAHGPMNVLRAVAIQ